MMLCGRESDQAGRISSAASYLSTCHTWAWDNDRRFMVTIGDNWIRYDDEVLKRTPKMSRNHPETTLTK